MEALEAKSDISFLKAQITADDKELRDIIRDHRKVAETDAPPKKRSAQTRNVLPYQAHAELMEEPMNISVLLGAKFRSAFEDGKEKSWSGWDRQVPHRPRATSRF
jgi:DNA polymerase gamma 1